MNLGVLLVVYIITMAELVWLLKCTNIGIKNLHFAGYGLALLVVIGLIFGSKIGSGGEGPLGMRSAFFITILMLKDDTRIVRQLSAGSSRNGRCTDAKKIIS